MAWLPVKAQLVKVSVQLIRANTPPPECPAELPEKTHPAMLTVEAANEPLTATPPPYESVIFSEIRQLSKDMFVLEVMRTPPP